MKFHLLITLSLISTILGNAQSSVNSGATSSNDLISSVGEIYVLPVNENEASSGTIGAVSRIEFALSIDEVGLSSNLRFYPNPTSNTVFLETQNLDINNISIYDITGRLISTISINDNRVDLSNLQAGTYFLKPDNLELNPIKIVKQ